ncbi:type IV pilus modification PilV family protein [Planctomonas psychrotolerans]|uniref:type IV pilus modification PilV family protein n=1 Tax=Planctomonas psychrotolerans TaxID=2528712 RepID=UPI00123B5914|nr:type II secretion system protein [Planctomonas psychrotolerans]
MSTVRTTPDDGDAGFGMIEIVVSMFLLGILAIAFLPLLVTSMTTTATNTSFASASQLVGQQLDAARALGPTCAAVQAFDDTLPAPTTDPRGVEYQPRRAVSPCPSSFPGTVPVRVWVTEVGDTRSLSEAVTLVFVESAA